MSTSPHARHTASVAPSPSPSPSPRSAASPSPRIGAAPKTAIATSASKSNDDMSSTTYRAETPTVSRPSLSSSSGYAVTPVLGPPLRRGGGKSRQSSAAASPRRGGRASSSSVASDSDDEEALLSANSPHPSASDSPFVRQHSAPSSPSPLDTPEDPEHPLKDSGELRRLIALSWPQALSIMCMFGMGVTDLAVVGHLGTDYLAAASVALVWTTITSVFVQRGFGTAVSTLCSQAYGAGRRSLVGRWLQLGLIACTVSTVPVSVAWIFTEPVLRFAGIHEKTAHLAQRFAVLSIAWLWPNYAFQMLSSFLQAQGIVRPQVVVSGAFLVINAGLNMLLVHGVGAVRGLGFDGSPLATTISRWGQLLALWLYACVYLGLHRPCWPVNAWRTVARAMTPNRSRQFFGLSFPLIIAGCLEEWQLQGLSILAARVGAVDVATHSAVINVFLFVSSLMFGASTATTVRVGFYLGAGRARSARAVALLSLTRIFAPLGIGIGLLFVALRTFVGRIFSSDHHVWHLASVLSVYVAAGYTLLSFFYFAMSTLDAQGRAGVVAVSFFIGAWCFTIPLAYVFAFPLHHGLLGIWWALVGGYAITTLLSAVAVLRSDWEQLAREARERAFEGAAPLDDASGSGSTAGSIDAGGSGTQWVTGGEVVGAHYEVLYEDRRGGNDHRLDTDEPHSAPMEAPPRARRSSSLHDLRDTFGVGSLESLRRTHGIAPAGTPDPAMEAPSCSDLMNDEEDVRF